MSERCQYDDAGSPCGKTLAQGGCSIHGREGTEHKGHRVLVNGHDNEWCEDCEAWLWLNGAMTDRPSREPRPHECPSCGGPSFRIGTPSSVPPAAPLNPNEIEDILADAESDGIIGPDYTPRRLAQYIVDSLSQQDGTEETRA